MEPSLETLKLAPTSHAAVASLLRRRWSPRAFDPTRAVDPETLATILEAATWAPSSGNEQPWLFAYAHRADEAFATFFSCLTGGNRAWADRAAVLLVAMARMTAAGTGKPNAWAWHDVGAATTTLMLQATELGLYGHAMGGFDAARTREVFALPEHVQPTSFIALGYLGDEATLPEPFLTRERTPRTRKPLNEVAFQGKPVF